MLPDAYVWLAWSCAVLAPWLAIFAARPDCRERMLWGSVLAAPLGFSEVLWAPQSWRPPTVLGPSHRSGVDLESVIFSFAIGGVASVLHDVVARRAVGPPRAPTCRAPRHARPAAIVRRSARTSPVSSSRCGRRSSRAYRVECVIVRSVVTRPLTPEIRAQIGLPAADRTPYRWMFAVMIVAFAAVPLVLAGFAKGAVAVAAFAFVILPAYRVWERREIERLEQAYVHGDEAVARVVCVEPAGPGRTDRTVRLEFFAGGERVRASVVGSPLTRKGLAPGDDVVVTYTRGEPSRCVLVERVRRTPKRDEAIAE